MFLFVFINFVAHIFTNEVSGENGFAPLAGRCLLGGSFVLQELKRIGKPPHCKQAQRTRDLNLVMFFWFYFFSSLVYIKMMEMTMIKIMVRTIIKMMVMTMMTFFQQN